MNLFDLSHQYQAAFDAAIDPETGEILDAEPDAPSDELLTALTLIDAAEDLAALEGLVDALKTLPEADKPEAKRAYAKKQKLLKAQQTPVENTNA